MIICPTCNFGLNFKESPEKPMYLSARGAKMSLKQTIKHYLNPLHVFCRLRDINISKRLAGFLSQNYEKYCWSFIKIFL